MFSAKICSQGIFYEMFGNPVNNEKGWGTGTLGSVAAIARGASPRPIKEYVGGSVLWIKIGDATKGNDFYIRNTKEHITEEGAERSVILNKGSVILFNGASIGFARILAIKGCIHDGWLSINEYDKVFVDVFLIYLLDAFKSYLEHLAPRKPQHRYFEESRSTKTTNE